MDILQVVLPHEAYEILNHFKDEFKTSGISKCINKKFQGDLLKGLHVVIQYFYYHTISINAISEFILFFVDKLANNPQLHDLCDPENIVRNSFYEDYDRDDKYNYILSLAIFVLYIHPNNYKQNTTCSISPIVNLSPSSNLILQSMIPYFHRNLIIFKLWLEKIDSSTSSIKRTQKKSLIKTIESKIQFMKKLYRNNYRSDFTELEIINFD